MSLAPSVALLIEPRGLGDMTRLGGSPDITIKYDDGSEGTVNFGEPEIGLRRTADGEFAIPLALDLWRHGVEHDDPDHHVIGLQQAITGELDSERNGYGRLDTVAVHAVAADLERIAAELREWAKSQG